MTCAGTATQQPQRRSYAHRPRRSGRLCRRSPAWVQRPHPQPPAPPCPSRPSSPESCGPRCGGAFARCSAPDASASRTPSPRQRGSQGCGGRQGGLECAAASRAHRPSSYQPPQPACACRRACRCR
eukprot:23257_3